MTLLRRKYAVLALCIGVAACLVGASPANAASPYYSFHTQSSWGALCMDVSYADTANGTGIKQWPCDGGPAQKWSLQYELSDGIEMMVGAVICGAPSVRSLTTMCGVSVGVADGDSWTSMKGSSRPAHRCGVSVYTLMGWPTAAARNSSWRT